MIKVGDVLYYVVEVDMPNDGGVHAWNMDSERVKQVRRDGSFKFERTIYFQRIYKAHNIDTRFHRTPEAAIAAFVKVQNKNIQSANHAINEAKRAIRWATSKSTLKIVLNIDPRLPAEAREIITEQFHRIFPTGEIAAPEKAHGDQVHRGIPRRARSRSRKNR